MEPIAALVVVFVAAILLLLPFEAANLRQRAVLEHLTLTRLQSFRIALLSISASFALAIFAFFLVLFGPAYALGDITTLPWITALPALIAGFWVARRISGKIVASAFTRLGSVA